VNVGRTGALTPVAIVDPVQLSGTVVSRASLHNEQIVGSLDIRVGDLVTLEKAGEIIPQVVSVDHTARAGDAPPFRMPTACPSCSTPVERVEGEVAVRCPNPTCPDKVKGDLFHYSRRFAMDVDHLGESLISTLIDRGLVKDVADLYELRAESLEALERMGKKSADNVIQSIAASKARTLDRLITGLGIDGIGQVAAKQLAEKAGSLDTLLAWDGEAVAREVGSISGFGPKLVDSVQRYLADPATKVLLRRLKALDVSRPQPKHESAATGPLAGSSFCVTGVLSRRREDVHADIRAQGGEIHDKVKQGTTYLVAGEKVGKTKLDAAKKHGTRVLTEAELAVLLAGGTP
jgi:DNA ligase (NAD+)